MLIYYFRVKPPHNSKNLPAKTQGDSNVEYEKMYFNVTRTYYSTVIFTDVPIEPLPWIPKSVEAPGVRVEFQLIGVIT